MYYYINWRNYTQDWRSEIILMRTHLNYYMYNDETKYMYIRKNRKVLHVLHACKQSWISIKESFKFLIRFISNWWRPKLLIKNLTYLATCRPIGSITIGDPFLRANLVNVCTLIYFFPFTFPSYSSCHDHKFCVTVAILSD